MILNKDGRTSDSLDNSVTRISTFGLPCLCSFGSEAASYGVVRNDSASVVAVVWLEIDHVDATKQNLLQDEVLSDAVGQAIQAMPRTVSTQMVLFSTRVPGAPNNTIPPSVGLLIRLLRIKLLLQATLIPSAHS